MRKQVDKSHYEFSRYVTKQRWASMWHQLDEVLRLAPERILEIGPGVGVFKSMASLFGVRVETLDIDPELKPDYVASVFRMPFDRSLLAFGEMGRVASRAIVISLPDAATRWPMSIYVPKIGSVRFSVPRPRIRNRRHVFDGEHYWEINKSGYALRKVIKSLEEQGPLRLSNTFRVHENMYHRFFIFHKY